MSNDLTNYLVELSPADKLILDSYCNLCDCLTTYLGGGYEIVVHSLGQGDHFIKRIANGHYSDRVAGSVGIGLSESPGGAIEHLLLKLQQGELPITTYFSENAKGDIFRSATVGIVGEGQRLIGMMCFNFFLNTPISEIIELLSVPKDVVVRKAKFTAYMDQDYEAILSETIQETKLSVMGDPDIPAKFKKKEIIRRLNEAGVFNIKNGVIMCADMLGIRVATVYMHLRSFSIDP
ncbi:MAG: hypothetical protein HFF07_01665 [Oscillospiraceae bacterium]|nr:hypothetical protein [Oscillospiraceae bacterium]